VDERETHVRFADRRIRPFRRDTASTQEVVDCHPDAIAECFRVAEPNLLARSDDGQLVTKDWSSRRRFSWRSW
jgi:hypothetical protein